MFLPYIDPDFPSSLVQPEVPVYKGVPPTVLTTDLLDAGFRGHFPRVSQIPTASGEVFQPSFSDLTSLFMLDFTGYKSLFLI